MPTDEPPTPFRREVVTVRASDGGLDLVDLLLDRVIHLLPAQVESLHDRESTLISQLAKLGLFESLEIDNLRARIAAARVAEPQPPPAAPAIAGVDWAEAADWPPMVTASWRDPERLRRLAEDRAAGRRYLMLSSFIASDSARAIANEVAALPYQRFESALVRADKCLLTDDQLTTWRQFLLSPTTRRLFGALLGVELPAGTKINAWKMAPGDGMGVHPDGRLYWATVSLGLCSAWTAADGGAIAFGDPDPDGTFVTRERWLPHLGDLCLFVPTKTTWHFVEPAVRQRSTLTGWWVTP